MLETLNPKIEYIDGTGSYGRFSMEPLDGGFGITLGNSMRRVLLALLPGAAITAVKIDEVEHEISTIAGIKEDTMELLLNVKEIRLRPLSDQPGRMNLEVSGQKKVTAGDIRTYADFEIVNPDLYLATLDSNEATLTVEFYVEHGKGYSIAIPDENMPLGVIPIDAIYSPVRRVKYNIEKIRVGQFTNCDRLILEVWTDDSITAIEAVKKAAQIIIDNLVPFRDIDEFPQEDEESLHGLDISQEQYNMPIEQLGLSVRTLNSLRRSKFTIAGEILGKTKDQLIKEIKNFGQKSLEELWDKLSEFGLLTDEEEQLDNGEEAEVITEEKEETEDEA
ncbi:DNA-directed RNA polymerase subunit alpha [Chloroflexota bacterium]